MHKYNHNKIEKKWQRFWEKQNFFSAKDFSSKKKFYALIEFPYPSGEGLHVGHPRSYTALDIISRKRRMEGENVLYPIGFDSFGLPAENYAIKTGTHPKITTERNIKTFTRQLKSLGFSFDWSRAFSTSDPKYYRWTQWIFLQFFRNGFAYKAKIPINWCPSCKIGLANEEVSAGKCERCGNAVERREKEQWLLRITRYAERLIQDLDFVDYLEPIKIQQKNWIGRSEGVVIKFFVRGQGSDVRGQVEVFTTRPDTVFGATFMVIAPEHPLFRNKELGIRNQEEVDRYLEAAKRKFDLERTELAKDKTGVELRGIKAVNPANGKEIPVFVADYVLTSYGTGAIMGVPAHDKRDFEFAKKYSLPVVEVIKPLSPEGRGGGDKDSLSPERRGSDKDSLSPEGRGSKGEGAYEDTENGVMAHSGQFDGLSVKEGIQKITQWLVEKNLGRREIQYKLRDWVFSRQRYWGEPIPLVYCENCKQQKQKVLLVHGFEGGAEKNWFPWMKRELEKNGFEVFAPDLPDPAHPNLLAWLKTLEPHVKKMGENDIIVGHSLGSKAALHAIAAFKKVFGSAYLVASAIGEIHERDWSQLEKKLKGADIESLKKFWSAPLDFEAIEKYARRKIFILSDDDPYVHKLTHKNLPAHWDYRLWKGFGHFDEPKAPELLSAILESKHTGWVEVPEKDLPVKLPMVKNFLPTDSGESPLAQAKSWVKTICPVCRGGALRETDVMPNWAGSNWYYLAYTMRGISNFQFPISKYKEVFKYWMPVDWYNGGMEHTTLHLLYSRFVYKFLWDIGAVPRECGPEPYKKRTSHGLILGEGGEKMSKSKGNVVNPDDIVKEFGADVFRLYEMFIGPFHQPSPWDTKGILGIKRFLDRVWRYSWKIQNPNLEKILHQTIKKVSEDIESMNFNTAVSALMILFHEIERSPNIEAFKTFLILLSPFAPHIAEEIWQKLGHKKSIQFEPWPRYDKKVLEASEFQIVIQVNGRVRDSMTISSRMSEQEIIFAALSLEKVKKYADKNKIAKTIYVPKRILNIVTI